MAQCHSGRELQHHNLVLGYLIFLGGPPGSLSGRAMVLMGTHLSHLAWAPRSLTQG